MVHSGTFSRHLPGKVRQILKKMPSKFKHKETVNIGVPSINEEHPYLCMCNVLKEMDGCSASELSIYQEFYKALADVIGGDVI